MYITRHSTLTNPQMVDQLWELYELSYAKIAEEDITRETLFRSEFNEVLADATYRKTVVHGDDERPVAMGVIATDIGVTRYLSVPYFRRRYPERLAQGRIHYVMWVIVRPGESAKASFELGRAALEAEATEGTLLVFDLPESNQPNERGGGAELLRRIAASVAEVELQSFGVSRYYALDFAADEEREVTSGADAESGVESSSVTA